MKLRVNPKTSGRLKTDRAAQLVHSAYADHHLELHRFLMRRLGRPQDASDLMQEIFLRLLRIDQPDLVRKPIAYLYGIASHVLREFRIGSTCDPVLFDSEVADHLAERSQQPGAKDPFEELVIEDQIEEAMALLPPTHKAVLLMHKRDGLSREEIAKQLGLSMHTVKKYIFQAMAMVRANWLD